MTTPSIKQMATAGNACWKMTGPDGVYKFFGSYLHAAGFFESQYQKAAPVGELLLITPGTTSEGDYIKPGSLEHPGNPTFKATRGRGRWHVTAADGSMADFHNVDDAIRFSKSQYGEVDEPGAPEASVSIAEFQFDRECELVRAILKAARDLDGETFNRIVATATTYFYVSKKAVAQ